MKKKQKKLLAQYNNPETMLVVSTYPQKGSVHGASMGGVASYTKRSMVPVAQKGQPVVVLAEIIKEPEVYEEEGVLVVRCWRRNSLSGYLRMWRWMLAFWRVRKVLFQFEFALYGDFWVAGMFPLIILASRLLWKRPAAVLHQVLKSLSELSGHVGLRKGSVKERWLSGLLGWFYRLVGWFSSAVVVLEPEFKRRLVGLGINKDRVEVIPHGVESRRELETKQAKRQLGIWEEDKVVLVFGFLTWYKGVDLAVAAFEQLLKTAYFEDDQQRVQLILAGGESLTQQDKPHYREFVRALHERVARLPNVWITGRVEEEMISTYFSAADLVLMPYRSFMSSSGVLALALAHGKPVLASEEMREWFDAKAYLVEAESGSLARGIVDWLEQEKVSLSGEEAKVLQRERSYERLAGLWVELWPERMGVAQWPRWYWNQLYQATYNFLWVR